MLIDTDVLIWYLRGNQNALEAIERENGFALSVVTYIELVQGMRNKKELIYLRKALRNWNTQILYLTEEISAKAMFYVEQYYLSHSLQLADALIGATTVSHGLQILIGNDKHYKIIKEIQISRFRP
jgi:hypothetical protein